MKITNWYITGDTHSDFSRFKNFYKNISDNQKFYGIIILGDCGFNFYLNKTDEKKKKCISEEYPTLIFYCVRGNHEARPENISTMKTKFDENVNNFIFIEDKFPNIRYFIDGLVYEINKKKILIIGGAYSVDKWFRLKRTYLNEITNNPKISGWFPDEQLTIDEMTSIETTWIGQHFDYVLSHTCPYSWQPTDLFLKGLDQDSVDNTMELWMDKFKDTITFDYYLFGHYHADRIERPYVEQFYQRIESIDDIEKRWNVYKQTGNFDSNILINPKLIGQ